MFRQKERSVPPVLGTWNDRTSRAASDAEGRAIAFFDPPWALFAGPIPGDAAMRFDSRTSAAVVHPLMDAALA